MRTDPAAAVEKALRGRADVFLLGTLASHSCNPPVCIVMRPAGFTRLRLGLAEDTPANNKPKTLPLSAPNWSVPFQGIVNITVLFDERAVSRFPTANDRADILRIRSALPAILERIWNDRQELTRTDQEGEHTKPRRGGSDPHSDGP